MRQHALGTWLACAAALAFAPSPLVGAPPAGFTNEPVLQALAQPIALQFLPDGRMLILQKNGIILIADISDTESSPVTTAPYLAITNIDTGGERGLVEIALDPDFATNGWLYLYYSPDSPARFRVARFTHQEHAGGLSSTADPASEVVIWQDTNDFSSCCHYGGGLDVGPDGMLWLTTGEEFEGEQAQDPARSGGKVIRIGRDGTIPLDNPYHDGLGPNDDSIWAIGLRNPFRAGWDLPTGRFLIAEVGGNDNQISWEDLHVARMDSPGVNYGWPMCEGSCDNPTFTECDCLDHDDPIYTYRHSGSFASITGGSIYRGGRFPADPYDGAYFFGDYAREWICYLTFDPDDPMVVTGDFVFDQNAGSVISFAPGPSGELWYTTNDGEVRRIACTGAACPCAGDVDSSGAVGFNDIIQMLRHWGPCVPGPGPACPWDLNGNGEVAFADLSIVLASWGPCDGR